MVSIDVRISGRRQPGRPARGHRPAQRRPGRRRLPDPAPGARPGSTSTRPCRPSTRPRTPTACTRPTWACWPSASRSAPRPCTPLGIQAMLLHYEIPVAGRRVVIVGRGPTLGRPLSMLLSLKEPGANAAVTVVHTGVPDWADLTREADIVVGAAGVPSIITPDGHPARVRGHRRRPHLGGPQGPLRCGRVLRRGGGVDHAPARRGGGDHGRHAAAQHGDGGGAPGGGGAPPGSTAAEVAADGRAHPAAPRVRRSTARRSTGPPL